MSHILSETEIHFSILLIRALIRVLIYLKKIAYVSTECFWTLALIKFIWSEMKIHYNLNKMQLVKLQSVFKI